MEPINVVAEQETKPVVDVTQQRFVIEVKNGDDKFIFSCPPNATFQETFNATLQILLNIYDLSKKQAPEVKND